MEFKYGTLLTADEFIDYLKNRGFKITRWSKSCK